MERSARTRIRAGVTILLLITVGASVWYWLVEDLSPVDAIYQTVITISTVGFTELVDFTESTRIVTMAVILLGAGTTAYTLTALFEEFADERIQQARRRRMERSAREMVDHMVLCGYGRVGARIAADARRKGGEVAVVEYSAERSDEAERAGFTVIRGEATDDETLERAGIGHAAVLVAALASDADNLYIVLSGRTVSDDLRIIARASAVGSVPKLERAGADRVVNPEDMGATRMLAFATQPGVSDFLDVVLYEQDVEYEIDEARVGQGSDAVGRTLGQLDLRKRTGALVLAVRDVDGSFDTHPDDSLELRVAMIVIGIGTKQQLRQLTWFLDPERVHQRSKRKGEWPYI